MTSEIMVDWYLWCGVHGVVRGRGFARDCGLLASSPHFHPHIPGVPSAHTHTHTPCSVCMQPPAVVLGHNSRLLPRAKPHTAAHMCPAVPCCHPRAQPCCYPHATLTLSPILASPHISPTLLRHCTCIYPTHFCKCSRRLKYASFVFGFKSGSISLQFILAYCFFGGVCNMLICKTSASKRLLSEEITFGSRLFRCSNCCAKSWWLWPFSTISRCLVLQNARDFKARTPVLLKYTCPLSPVLLQTVFFVIEKWGGD